MDKQLAQLLSEFRRREKSRTEKGAAFDDSDFEGGLEDDGDDYMDILQRRASDPWEHFDDSDFEASEEE